ncbi:MAG: class I SAM-dependent methyltransferase [Chloroflexi bacterium]|nr:class I SAM-dependent methyltransferase [Chloroflexota bacterium]MBI3931094.1 class I SAM-dependent methyltransferase [Chloroflexota bacterium]
MLKDHQDACGHGFYEYLKNETGSEIIERDDGYIDTLALKGYFNKYKDWYPAQRKSMRHARGRVLDIGCGAGRHALYLQEKGYDVLGIDNSPLAIEVCKLRGLKNARVTSITQINSKLGVFDTILMMGNNFGLFGSFEGARRLLRKVSKITSENGRIIAESNDVYKTDTPEHLSYHQFNRKRGRMAGQIKLRVRYKKYATPWFDYLMVSKEEMENILDGTDWKVNRFIESDGSLYIAIIDKKKL